MLTRYMTDTQLLLNDAQGQFFSEPALINYINKSRRRCSYASGCLRALPAGIQTQPNQEAYPFSQWKSAVQAQFDGVESILACRSVAVSIGTGGWKPMWRQLVFSDFQARFRIYNGTFIGTISEPGWWAQYGVGPIARLYFAPIPTQANPMDVDLTCIPKPLSTDDDPEPIPDPWTDAVPYFAAVLCLLQQQRREDATGMAQIFNTDLPFCASVVCPTMLQNPYGATIRSA